MTLGTIFCLLICSFGWLGLSIGLGISFHASQITLAKGTLTGVNQCGCNTTDAICAKLPNVSIRYTARNFSTNFCSDCCESMVNQSILVQISPKNASIPLATFPVGEYPFNAFYLSCVCFSSFFTYIFCMAVVLYVRAKEQSQYQRV